MYQVGFVYTGTTPELITYLEDEAKKQLGEEASILTYEDPSILEEVRRYGYVPPAAASRLVAMYLQAVRDGAKAVLNVCSSVGETADATQELSRYLGVPFVRIDEAMCRDALCMGNRIGVLATLPTTLAPTKHTLRRLAREMGKYDITLRDGLVDAFQLNPEEFQELLVAKALEFAPETDVILLCQGSMAYCEAPIALACQRPVVSSPRYGVAALKQALIQKGVIPKPADELSERRNPSC